MHTSGSHAGVWRRTKKRSAEPADVATTVAAHERAFGHTAPVGSGVVAATPATPAAPAAPAPATTKDVLVALTRSDLKIRYGRGPLRRVKWLLDPIAALGVYLALIALVIDNEGRAAGLSVACAVVPFQLIMMTVVNALRAVELRRSIVANMSFRRVLIPVSSALTELVGFAGTLLLLPVMMAAYLVAPTPAVLLLPLMIAVTLVLAIAVAYPASLLGLWVPELAPFAVSAVRTLFFLAPGLVALDEVYGHTHDVLKLNPLSGVFEGFRAVLLDGAAPAAWHVLVPLAYAAALLAVFVPVYRREEPHFAKLI
jgi:lipopolysaccharide transport system permease protein